MEHLDALSGHIQRAYGPEMQICLPVGFGIHEGPGMDPSWILTCNIVVSHCLLLADLRKVDMDSVIPA